MLFDSRCYIIEYKRTTSLFFAITELAVFSLNLKKIQQYLQFTTGEGNEA